MIEALRAAVAKLDGWKTHASVLLLVAWVVFYLKFPGAQAAVGFENFGAVSMALLGAAGVSFRSAVAKVPAAIVQNVTGDPGDAKAPAASDAAASDAAKR